MRRDLKIKDQGLRLNEDKILIAGAGGQGIMFLGKIIGQAAVLENMNTTYIRSYGAEIRGGTANCMVKISKKSRKNFKNKVFIFGKLDQADIIFNFLYLVALGILVKT